MTTRAAVAAVLLLIGAACSDSSTSSATTADTTTTIAAAAVPATTGTVAPPVTTTTAVTVPGPALEVVEAELRDIAIETPPLQLRIAIPRLDGVPDAGTADTVNQYLLDITTRSEQTFVRDVTVYLDEVGVQEGPVSFLELSYEVGVLEPELLSMRFDETTYFQGAAHPGHGVYTITVDLESGRRLFIGDLFTGTEWAFALDFLVRQAVADTYYQGDLAELDAWVDPEAVLVPEDFMLRPLAFELWFPELAVGPAVLGAPSVLIPHSAIGVYIDPNGPVGLLVAKAEAGCAAIDAFGRAQQAVFASGAGSAERTARLEELRDLADELREARPDLTDAVAVLAQWGEAFVADPSTDLSTAERDAIEAANDELRAELDLCLDS